MYKIFVMQSGNLKFKFNGSEIEYSFENKLSIVEEKKLIQILKRPNIKNEDAPLMISSMNLHISDVVQIKINIDDTGVFLVSFNKDSVDEEKRVEMIDKIKALKTTEQPTKDISINKIKNLIHILNNYSPIYATFENKGELKIEISEIPELKIEFPILDLRKSSEEIKEKSKKIEKNCTKNKHLNFIYKIDFKMFSFDYLFVTLFTILFTFGVISGIYELEKGENVGIFLLTLGFIFACVQLSSVYTTIYKKRVKKSKYLRYYLSLFIILGTIIGITIGYFVSTKIIKNDNANFNIKKWIWLSIVITLPISLISLSSSRLVNLIIKKKYKNK